LETRIAPAAFGGLGRHVLTKSIQIIPKALRDAPSFSRPFAKPLSHETRLAQTVFASLVQKTHAKRRDESGCMRLTWLRERGTRFWPAQPLTNSQAVINIVGKL